MRLSTRAAALYRSMVRKSPLMAVPLEIRRLARDLGYSYQALVRVTGRLADAPAWFFQGYGLVIFLRYRKHKGGSRCGHPQFYVIGRQGWDRMGGRPRARLRQRDPAQWLAHLVRIQKIAFGQFLKGVKRADDNLKGSSCPIEEQEASLARPPPAANRPGLRRFVRRAAIIDAAFAALENSFAVDLHGWATFRLAEWHSAERIMECLQHALTVMPSGKWTPENRASWLCGVAKRHLERDGLHPIQRAFDAKKEGKRRQAAAAAASNELLKSAQAKQPDFIDQDGKVWKHLGGTNWSTA